MSLYRAIIDGYILNQMLEDRNERKRAKQQEYEKNFDYESIINDDGFMEVDEDTFERLKSFPKRKSVLVGLCLTLFFHVFGMFYANKKLAIFFILVHVFALFFCPSLIKYHLLVILYPSMFFVTWSEIADHNKGVKKMYHDYLFRRR